MDLGAVGQRRVCVAQRRQRREVLVEGVTRLVVCDRGGGVGADEVVVVVLGDLRREHVLARPLVTDAARFPQLSGEPLLVAVIDHRLSAGEVHQ